MMAAAQANREPSVVDSAQQAVMTKRNSGNAPVAPLGSMPGLDEAYRRGRWDLVIRSVGAERGKGPQSEIAIGRALRAWGVARRLIAQLQRSLGTAESTFQGFSHLDQAALPASPERALRQLGRDVLNRAEVDAATASFFANVARGDTDEELPWVESARAEHQDFELAIERVERRRRTWRATPTPAVKVSPQTAAEAYHKGRWDLALRLSDESPQALRISALALRDWRLSRDLLEQLARAIAWPDTAFRSFSHLDRRHLADAPEQSSGHSLPNDLERLQRRSEIGLAREEDAVALRALLLALQLRARPDHHLDVSIVEQNVGSGRYLGESRIIRALLGSGAIGEAGRVAQAATAGYGEETTRGLMIELGMWARNVGRYDLAIPLLRCVVRGDPSGRVALLEFVRVLQESELTRSLMTRLLDVIIPADRYRGFSHGFLEEVAARKVISDLRQHLAANPPPIAIAEQAWRLLPSAVPALALDPEVPPDEYAAAEQLADELLGRSLAPPKERDWFAAAIASDERVRPNLVLTTLGRRFVKAGRTLLAARQFDRALNVIDVPLKAVKAIQGQQVLIIDNYRQHRVIYFNGAFYGFYVHAPVPYLGPPPGKLLRFKLMVDAIVATLLPKRVYRGTMRKLHSWAIEVKALWVAARPLYSELKIRMKPLWRALKRLVAPVLPSVERAARGCRRLATPLARATRLAWRVVRRWVVSVLRNDAVRRFRHRRRYPIYRAESLEDLLAHVDLAIATARPKTS
jgi:hypothetical protein